LFACGAVASRAENPLDSRARSMPRLSVCQRKFTGQPWDELSNPPARQTPASLQVQLMATCLCDAFFDDVARATVEVLEYLGCAVEFPPGQTCCGQPAFNAGDWARSREVVRHALDVFAGDAPIVTPSGSCAAMWRHGALLEFQEEEDRARVEGLAARTWELADYIVHGRGITAWPGTLPARVAWHRSCHSRGTTSGTAAETLLRSITGLVLQPLGEAEQCCGFGGTFAVSFPHVSREMGLLKLEHVYAGEPDFLVSGDMGCLMHLSGLARRREHVLKSRHLAQILRDSLREAGLLPAPPAGEDPGTP
jgi:L-lactate dehydrogenase complex protein LldE